MLKNPLWYGTNLLTFEWPAVTTGCAPLA